LIQAETQIGHEKSGKASGLTQDRKKPAMKSREIKLRRTWLAAERPCIRWQGAVAIGWIVSQKSDLIKRIIDDSGVVN